MPLSNADSSPKVSISLILNTESVPPRPLPPRLPPPSLLSRLPDVSPYPSRPSQQADAVDSAGLPRQSQTLHPQLQPQPQTLAHPQLQAQALLPHQHHHQHQAALQPQLYGSPPSHPLHMLLLMQLHHMPVAYATHPAADQQGYPLLVQHQYQPRPQHMMGHQGMVGGGGQYPMMGLPMAAPPMGAPYQMMPMGNYGYAPYSVGNPVVVSPVNQMKPQNKHRRFRRRYYQIHRKYSCTFAGCNKSYGLLNHLNTHIVTKKHGMRKSKADFKHADKDSDHHDHQDDHDTTEAGDDHDASSSTNSTTPLIDGALDKEAQPVVSASSAASTSALTPALAPTGSLAPPPMHKETSESSSEALTDSSSNYRTLWSPSSLKLPSISAQNLDGPVRLPSLPSVVGNNQNGRSS